MHARPQFDHILRAFGVFAAFLALIAIAPTAAQAETELAQQSSEAFEREIKKTVRAQYLLYLPEGYNADQDKRWPLMIFLHGSGERGDNLKKVAKHGPPKLVEQGKEFPFIIVSPQCPHGGWWSTELLNAFYDDIMEKYRIDPSRVYLTGLSMGGNGTWAWAANNPEKFAAIAPVCGWGPEVNYEKLASMPIWAFHGDQDQAVALEKGQKVIDAVTSVGGTPEFTIYEGVGHNSWDPAYSNDALYDWLLSHSKDEQASVKE
ncbi:dienelactone hydrolase family protein [Cerasicoccus arenae]|uniref:Hydrolase n=1 Tax=Cerasicoccus arenae TaxID=424488 RepID=A0A8J3DA42_9BACT|nr:dienelactone hydrolase family protein [Cerasicoccus arenae]MBK1859795.1 dienelactone hydrolase family protein [Cerasicoccus arenae]GHB93763.1 hydrolase [Cerasicoccus arenae]